MSVKIKINNADGPATDYVGWAPQPCQILSTNGTTQRVVLSNLNPGAGGQVVFIKDLGTPVADTLELDLPANGNPVPFFIAGKFDRVAGVGHASTNDKDCVIKVIDKASSNQIGEKALMVRVRKDADRITSAERDRFLSAVVRLHQQGTYADFQNMHTRQADLEIHRRSSFLPWHRALLLDFERKLQEIDPSVALPYWRFDQPAPKVFSKDFMGVPDPTGFVDFSSTNPLINWKPTVVGQGSGRVRRMMSFSPNARPLRVQNNEAATLKLGTDFLILNSRRREGFCAMEADPHGGAHDSFLGQISDPATAPADPLFFLLHTNVDRLWAKWQWITPGQRFNGALPNAYLHQGSGNPALRGESGIGNFTDDTLWPWDGDFNFPRPLTGPNVPFTQSPYAATPGKIPNLKSMIDYQGQHNLSANLGFAYDDVPYDHPASPAV